MVPFQLSASGGMAGSDATGGHATSPWDSSGMVVNFGPSMTASGGLPNLLMIGALILGGLWLLKRR